VIWLSPQVAASRTGLSVWTIYRAIHAGELRAVKRRSRWLIPEEELKRFCGEAPACDTPETVEVKAKLAGNVLRMVRAALAS
jgi:excisionase family DNA binding protein